jgi:hypothetical protein
VWLVSCSALFGGHWALGSRAIAQRPSEGRRRGHRAALDDSATLPEASPVASLPPTLRHGARRQNGTTALVRWRQEVEVPREPPYGLRMGCRGRLIGRLRHLRRRLTDWALSCRARWLPALGQPAPPPEAYHDPLGRRVAR